MASELKRRLAPFAEKIRLHGDEALHEQTDSWSNRDLIPLPPSRRTWGLFEFFGYWTLSSLNVLNWQYPNTFLTEGLSVRQSMMLIVVGRFLIVLFSTLVAWCGLTWHIGFTIQNRFSWGMRASYIPLLQRILLNFIWSAIQVWNGGRLAAVCITAIWPSFYTMNNFLPESMPATGFEFVGYIVFWTVSIPFLFIAPEKFRIPFQVTSIYCGIGMLAMMIWALATAKGLGSLWDTPQSAPTDWRNTSWLLMAEMNQMVGGTAPAMTNGSDFSRYAKSWKAYLIGSLISCWVLGSIVSLGGLITTSAAQKIYGEIYWNPADLLMVMMDNGNGSSGSRAAVFFLAFGFALTSMFENVCGNVVAGGIDLAGLFPNYINIRRGAIITFVAAWIVQPWQLINKATTFVNVLSSFAVFLAPIIGIMTADFFILRKMKIRLSDLYNAHDTSYWYWHGINWRAVTAWICGWVPTIGGLVVVVNGETDASASLYQLYYMAFFIGLIVSASIFVILNKIFPVAGMGEYEELDIYGTFTAKEAAALGVIALVSDTEGQGDSERATEPTMVSESFQKNF